MRAQPEIKVGRTYKSPAAGGTGVTRIEGDKVQVSVARTLVTYSVPGFLRLIGRAPSEPQKTRHRRTRAH